MGRAVYDAWVMRWIANVAYLLASVVYLPMLCYQMVFQGKNRRGWRDRLGFVRMRPTGNRRIWVHGVSLGEINAARQIVEKLDRCFPDREVVVSSTTDTGYARACRLFGGQRVFRFPLDFSYSVGMTLRRVDPGVIVLMELEIWYNLVRMATGRGIRVAVINGRLTERSAKRLGRLGPITRSMFGSLSRVCAQDEVIASRFRSLGTGPERVSVTGSMKWDTASTADQVGGADRLAAAMGIDGQRPLWVCGSTGPGEETMILDAHGALEEAGAEVSLAIVPRKPERFDEVARLIKQKSYACIRRTSFPDGGVRSESPGGREVILGDTLGELGKFYALATVVFVGRSLVPMGGSDPMEAAALGKPVLAGPHMDNFIEPVEALRSRAALQTVPTSPALAEQVRRICDDQETARRMGRAARQVVIDHQGATETTLDALVELIEG